MSQPLPTYPGISPGLLNLALAASAGLGNKVAFTVPQDPAAAAGGGAPPADPAAMGSGAMMPPGGGMPPPVGASAPPPDPTMGGGGDPMMAIQQMIQQTIQQTLGQQGGGAAGTAGAGGGGGVGPDGKPIKYDMAYEMYRNNVLLSQVLDQLTQITGKSVSAESLVSHEAPAPDPTTVSQGGAPAPGQPGSDQLAQPPMPPGPPGGKAASYNYDPATYARGEASSMIRSIGPDCIGVQTLLQLFAQGQPK